MGFSTQSLAAGKPATTLAEGRQRPGAVSGRVAADLAGGLAGFRSARGLVFSPHHAPERPRHRAGRALMRFGTGLRPFQPDIGRLAALARGIIQSRGLVLHAVYSDQQSMVRGMARRLFLCPNTRLLHDRRLLPRFDHSPYWVAASGNPSELE